MRQSFFLYSAKSRQTANRRGIADALPAGPRLLSCAVELRADKTEREREVLMDEFRWEEQGPRASGSGIDEAALARLATVVYALQAASCFFPLTLFAAAIVNYMRRDDARGTWLERPLPLAGPHLLVAAGWFAVGGLTLFFVLGWFSSSARRACG